MSTIGDTGPKGDIGERGPRRFQGSKGDNGKRVKSKHIKLSFIALTLLFVITLVGFAIGFLNLSEQADKTKKLSHDTAILLKKTARLSKENSKRITEIQLSRVSSCKTTYRSYPLVFKPFLPKKPYTAQEKETLIKFSARVAYLIHRCEKQTKPKSKSNNKATQ